jgi:hypothetical protein
MAMKPKPVPSPTSLKQLKNVITMMAVPKDPVTGKSLADKNIYRGI